MRDLPETIDPPEHDEAGAHMETSVPTAGPDTPVSELFERLRGQRFKSAATVFVTDTDDRLLGYVRINDIIAGHDGTLADIMAPAPEAVTPEADQEDIAALAMRLDMISVPVVDDAGRFVGAVPPGELFRILREEHFEDLQHGAGISPHEDGPAASLHAPLLDRLRRRLPWLVFGLLASSLVTMVMVGFEEALAANVAVAFFVPALVYIAGAIGSQAVSVSVRALAEEKIAIGKLLRDEMIIGLGIGLSLGVLAAGGVQLVFGDALLSLAVGLAILGGGAVSAVVGFALPWTFDRLGADPALGSGPVCTIIQDAASLAIYFLSVSVFVM